MKILIIQLARLGDIYLSWPAIRALKRSQPDAEVTLLTRDRFVAATEGLHEVDKIEVLPVKEILVPMITDNLNVALSHQMLKDFVLKLRGENFNKVINLSFSPAASYLSHLIASSSEQVSGYTRTEDGYLAMPDSMSAYFYAQVGPERANRFHLAEIFGTLCGVDLAPEDWRTPDQLANNTAESFDFLCHIGASEAHKTLSADKWISILSQLKSLRPQASVGLIGVQSEVAIAEKIQASISGLSITNFVGQKNLSETMALIQNAKLLVCPDSAPMHMASLVGTRCLNISIGRVNFWETGPRAAGSWVLRARNEVDLPSDRVARAIVAQLENTKPELGIIQVQPGTPSYAGLFSRDAEFAWKLVQAVYQGTPFPETSSEQFWQAHQQLTEVNQFILEQLTALQAGANLRDRAPLLDRGEEVISAIAKVVPAWGPVLRWYQTEKIRIAPGETSQILNRTIEIQNLLQQVLLVYSDMQANQTMVESEAR